MAESQLIEKSDQFEDTPEGKQALWTVEMAAADKETDKWRKRGDKVIARYIDDRPNENTQTTRVNLFTANVQTTRALLYGQTPRVGVERRFADPGDDPARIAGEILQRLLNTDIERDSDTYSSALFHALDDWLLTGLGNIRLRYEAKFVQGDPTPAILDMAGEELAPEVPGEEIKESEAVEYDYAHWKDQRWSPCRHFGEVRWWAFKADMTRDALHKRFGGEGGLSEDEIDAIPLNSKDKNTDAYDSQNNNPWQRAEVWEIWSRDDRMVYWWVAGSRKILDSKPDPLGLDGFFPFPEPLIANGTSSKLIPVPDFTLGQDQYDEIDEISTRITMLEKALIVRGVYDKTNVEIGRLLSEAKTNDMIPVDNFAMFAEKGGIKGAVDWFPIEMVVLTLDKLREYRQELIALSYQVTGMSDIMRGQSSGQTTATEQSIKAKFAGVRMQFRQQEFARFASDLQKLKAEIIAKHFDVETIIKGANTKFMNGVDEASIQAAVQMIKDDVYQYRVEVKPEAISMADYAAVKQERSEMLTAVATFLQSSMPVMQAAPQMTPMLLQMLQWALAGFRGGSTIEGVIDQTIVKIQRDMQQKAQQPPPPDPEMIKAQMEMKQLQMKGQIDMQKSQTDLQAAGAKHQMDIQKARMDLQGKGAELGMRQQEIQLEASAKQQQMELDAQSANQKAEISTRQMQMKERADAMKVVNDVTRSTAATDAAVKKSKEAPNGKRNGK
jgi:uncharacterized protein YaaQ